MSPPTSTTSPPAVRNRGVQAGSPASAQKRRKCSVLWQGDSLSFGDDGITDHQTFSLFRNQSKKRV
jgi:hypothetical protein